MKSSKTKTGGKSPKTSNKSTTKSSKPMKTTSTKTASKKSSGKKRGRPLGSKNKPKQVQATGSVSVIDAMVSVSAPAETPHTLIEKSTASMGSSSKSN